MVPFAATLAALSLVALPSTTSRVEHVANGTTKSFTFTFPVTTSSSHVEVLVAGVKQLAGVEVTLNVNQSVTPGGTVRFTSAPSTGATVRIQRTVPLTQDLVLTPYSAFPAKGVEKALDRIVAQQQQLDREKASLADVRDYLATVTSITYPLLPGGSQPPLLDLNFSRVGAYCTGSYIGASSYPITFSRGTPGTFFWSTSGAMAVAAPSNLRVSAVPVGARIEPGTSNLIGSSEALDDATFWSTVSVSVAANALVGPDGQQTAEVLTKTDATGSRYIRQDVTLVPGQTYTAELWAIGVGSNLSFAMGVLCGGWPAAQARIISGPGSLGPPTILGEMSIAAGAYVTGYSLSASQWTRFAWTFTAPEASCAFIIYPAGTGTGNAGAQLGVTKVQIEPRGWPSSDVPPVLAGTTTRSDELLTVPNPLGGESSPSFCVDTLFMPDGVWTTVGADIIPLVSSGSYGQPHSFSLVAAAGNQLQWRVYGASGYQGVNYAHSWQRSTRHLITGCIVAGAPSLYVDGAAVGTPVSAGAATIAMPGYIRIGSSSDGRSAAGTFARVTLDRRTSAGHVLPDGITSTVASIAAIGDSITAGNGVTTPYPTTLANLLGRPVGNYGYAGAGTGQVPTNWVTMIKPTVPGAAVVLLGINDIQAGETAAATWTRLAPMLDSIKGTGARLVPVTVLPFRGSSNWTAGRETERLALNTTIMAYCTSNALTCVDAATDMDDGSGYLQAAYAGADHLHLSQAGADRLATLVRAAFP